MRVYCLEEANPEKFSSLGLPIHYNGETKDNPDYPKPTTKSYEWKRKDGAIVTLSVSVKFPNKENKAE